MGGVEIERSICIGVDGTICRSINGACREETGVSKGTKGIVGAAKGLELASIFLFVFLATILTYYLPK
jgi:hypothetical protein